jgi:diguanylate cyclase (GGDEF)-like protein
MNARLRRFLPFLLGASIAVTLATLLIRVRYELEAAREAAHLRSSLEIAAGEVRAELDRGERALTSPSVGSRWHSWHLGIASARGVENRTAPLAEAALRRALPAHTLSGEFLLGPLANDEGGNALALASSESAGAGVHGWRGVWAPVDEVMRQPAVVELVRQGYRLQLYDTAEAAPLYQSDSGHLDAAAGVPLRFAQSLLELRAAPRAGWAVPLRVLSSSLLVCLAVLAWLSYELRRGRALRSAAEDLGEAEARRKEANLLYSNALRSLSDMESRLQLVSLYDSATGLANRSSLVRRIEAALDAMRESRRGALCLMAIGFDHDHHISSSFGSGFASRVLVIAAQRVQSVLPSKDLLFRTGDFHLAVVLPDTEAARNEALAARVIEVIESPITLDSHTFMLHPSIGVAETRSGYEQAETLLDHASAALSAVSRDAPQRYCLFDSAAARESVSRLQLEVDLDRAFEEGQFVLEYEPFVIPVAHSVAGFEALIRWNHPTEGRLLPGRFVPIALQAGMSHRLNHWVLREAARQAAAWRRAGHTDLFVNFNLSAEAFLRPHLVEEIGAVLAEFDLPGKQLIVELTESTLVQDIRGAARTLQRLGDLGIGAWLDDFGTGYSSLSHLRALPLKGVKIDRSFIESIDLDSRDFGFLKALIDLISYLGMQSIVEGIETVSQYELLSLTACDLYQGYYFAHSMSAKDAAAWMQTRGTAPDAATPTEPLSQGERLRRLSG